MKWNWIYFMLTCFAWWVGGCIIGLVIDGYAYAWMSMVLVGYSFIIIFSRSIAKELEELRQEVLRERYGK